MSAGSPKQRISSAKLPFRPRTTMFASVSQIAEPDASSRHGQSHLNMAASKKEIFKFPRTRHVYNTGGGASRDDLVRVGVVSDLLWPSSSFIESHSSR